METLERIEDKLDQVLKTHPRGNRLLRQKEIREELGLDLKGRDWQAVRSMLIEQYGMRHYPGMGHRILRKNFDLFLKEKFTK